jgi:hypothetical protein
MLALQVGFGFGIAPRHELWSHFDKVVQRSSHLQLAQLGIIDLFAPLQRL